MRAGAARSAFPFFLRLEIGRLAAVLKLTVNEQPVFFFLSFSHKFVRVKKMA